MSLTIRLLILIISHHCSSQFTEGPSVLPRADDSIAIGYDANTDTILLVGGTDNKRAFVTFKNGNFSDIGATYLTTKQQTYGYSQHFTQINDELWIIRDDGGGFITMNTTAYTVDIPSIDIPIGVDSAACLASVPGYLVVIGGGWPTLTAVPQIYRISDNQWLSNVPSLASGLIRISCVVVNDILYVIGGSNETVRYTDTIQYLDISNMNQISTQSWRTLSGRLATARTATRAVVYGTDIYVVGGDESTQEMDVRSSDVNVINTLTGSVTVSADNYLPYGTSYAPSIIVDNTLYVFGGWISLGYTNKYSYKTLSSLSSDPTKAGTPSPTQNQIKNPTNNPTAFPTVNPTISLSQDPTRNPTQNPTGNASKSPTKDPTRNPTQNHTNNPSESTTHNPTTFPTKNTISSTTNPTQNPSKYPSESPSFNPIEHPITNERTNTAVTFVKYWILSFVVVLCIILCIIFLLCIRRKIPAEYDGAGRTAKYIRKTSKRVRPVKLQEELPKANDAMAIQRVESPIESDGTVGNTDDTMKTNMNAGEQDWEFNRKYKEVINQVQHVNAEVDGVVETTIGANTRRQ